MGLVAIVAAQVNSSPDVSVILKYSREQVATEDTKFMLLRDSQWKTTNCHELINDLIPYTESIQKDHFMIIESNKTIRL